MLLLAFAPLTAACGGGGDKDKEAIEETAEDGEAATFSTVSTEDPIVAGQRNFEQAQKEVKATFDTDVFGQNSTTDQRVAAIENGEDLRDFVDAAFADPAVKAMGFDVTGVAFLDVNQCSDQAATDKPCGVVTANVLDGGQPTELVNQSIFVVFPQCEGDGSNPRPGDAPCGRWKISQQSLCALLAPKNQTCPAGEGDAANG